MPKKRKGFSLAEAMMAVVVVSIAAAGVTLPFTSGAAAQAEGLHRTMAAKLAEAAIEEIVVASSYMTLAQIITQYNYTELNGDVTDSYATRFTDSNYAAFSRDVSCSYTSVPQESGAGVAKYVLATVRIYYNDDQIAEINRLITE